MSKMFTDIRACGVVTNVGDQHADGNSVVSPAAGAVAVAAQSLPLSPQAPGATIPGMTVAEVREALKRLRIMWQASTADAPLFLTAGLTPRKTVAEFSTEHVYGHHLRRHQKSVRKKDDAAFLQKLANNTPGAKIDASEGAPVENAVDFGVPGPKCFNAGDTFPFTRDWLPSTVSVDPVAAWWRQSKKPRH